MDTNSLGRYLSSGTAPYLSSLANNGQVTDVSIFYFWLLRCRRSSVPPTCEREKKFKQHVDNKIQRRRWWYKCVTFNGILGFSKFEGYNEYPLLCSATYLPWMILPPTVQHKRSRITLNLTHNAHNQMYLPISSEEQLASISRLSRYLHTHTSTHDLTSQSTMSIVGMSECDYLRLST